MKKKRRLSLYDTIFLLALIVGVLLIMARYRLLTAPPDGGGDATAKVTYTFDAESVAKLSSVLNEDKIYLQKDGALLGTLAEKMTFSPKKTEVVRRDGTVVLLDSQTAYELRGTMLVRGKLNKNGFFLKSGEHIAVNQRKEVQIGQLNVTILVLKIDIFSSN